MVFFCEFVNQKAEEFAISSEDRPGRRNLPFCSTDWPRLACTVLDDKKGRERGYDPPLSHPSLILSGKDVVSGRTSSMEEEGWGKTTQEDHEERARSLVR